MTSGQVNPMQAIGQAFEVSISMITLVIVIATFGMAARRTTLAEERTELARERTEIARERAELAEKGPEEAQEEEA